MRLAKREWRAVQTWRVPLSAVGFGLLLGITGPFGSQQAYPTAVKYAVWMIISLAGFGAAVAAERMLPPVSPGQPKWTRRLLVAAIAAVPMTFFVAWVFGVARPGRAFSPLQLLGLYPFVALIQLLIAWIVAPASAVPAAAGGEPSVEPPQYPREFLAKLPVAMRRDIVALEAEDHYLRVHTLHGSALVLMRLADAAALIDPRLGLRVHRSWWVAKAGVRALERTSGRAIARLVNDTAVPVSRGYLAEARAAIEAQE